MKMNQDYYDATLDRILKHIKWTLSTKSEEYVRNQDYMHNFNQGAKKTGEVRERIIEQFRLKHEISREDIIQDIENNCEIPDAEYLVEKYGDIINYYILELMSVLQRNTEQMAIEEL